MIQQSTKDRLAVNLAALHKMASAWVMTVAGMLGTLWLAMPPEQQSTLMGLLPIPPWLIPIALTLVGLAARAWPQKNITPAEAAAKSADGPDTLGLPTIPKE